MIYLLGLAAVVFGSFGQLCLKLGASGVPLTEALTRPYTISGFLLYGISSVFWLAVLKKLPLSTAYPLLALNFVLIIAVSALLLREPVGLYKVFGTGFIVAGIVLVGR